MNLHRKFTQQLIFNDMACRNMIYCSWKGGNATSIGIYQISSQNPLAKEFLFGWGRFPMFPKHPYPLSNTLAESMRWGIMVEILPGDETFGRSEPWKRGVKVVCLRIKKLLYMRNSFKKILPPKKRKVCICSYPTENVRLFSDLKRAGVLLGGFSSW